MTRTRSVFVALLWASPLAAGAQRFVVTDTSVRQGRFEAVALSRDSIVSSYPRAAREVRFRFSINGLENEFPGGTEHTIYLRPRGERLVTSLYTFGVEDAPPPPTPEESSASEDGVARVTFRVDLRHVLRALRTTGRYQPPLGAPILRGGLQHVYVLGEPAPLSWDYAALRPGSQAELTDRDGDGVYEGTVAIPTAYTRPRTVDGRALWARQLDIGAFPSVSSSQRIQDAIYRLSLEELRQLVRTDGALSAGAKWPGVWTRDVALSSVLSLAIVAPDAVRRSLLAKVDSSGRIIQDTGTGGSWPISSDRMAWSLAAMEVYEVTGDKQWLRQAYDITRRSAEADLHAVRDPETGLFDGESSFMDWREQSYPRWMQPADIYRSQNLGTNAVHYAAYRTLASMARALGEPSARWDSVAAGIQQGMTSLLWQRDLGWFAQYRYGRVSRSLSPRTDGLGEALAVIYGAADSAQRRTVIRRAPVVEFGTPTFWPFIPGERFYHNATVWPFVTAYWTWAAAEGGNTLAVQRGLDDATRTTALFLTNKENLVAATGHYEGTALNSDRQLWSVAGTLASTYRMLFGMRLEPERLAFRPMVPPSYGGERSLSGLHYRGATLAVTVRGHGDAVAEARLDGRVIPRAEVPADLVGEHTLVLAMNGRWPATEVHEVPSRFAPATPAVQLRLAGGPPPTANMAADSAATGIVSPPAASSARQRLYLSWNRVPGAVRYQVWRDGRPIATTTSFAFRANVTDGLHEYQVLAVNALGDESFLSEPLRLVPPSEELVVRPSASLAREVTGYTAEGYIRLTRDSNRVVTLPVRIERAGSYVIEARYANGNGPVNTDDKAAIRTLVVDGDTAGVLVMPQRGAGRWSEWGWSSIVRVPLRAGTHTIAIVYAPLDDNMNGRVNTALLDHLRLTRVTGARPPATGNPKRLP